tara:strand:+ start:1787 stop:1996 length:210 start_codon:yes stop_codon:yes gene_type:complete
MNRNNAHAMQRELPEELYTSLHREDFPDCLDEEIEDMETQPFAPLMNSSSAAEPIFHHPSQNKLRENIR